MTELQVLAVILTMIFLPAIFLVLVQIRDVLKAHWGIK
jgi:hypothetical protein